MRREEKRREGSRDENNKNNSIRIRTRVLNRNRKDDNVMLME